MGLVPLCAYVHITETELKQIVQDISISKITAVQLYIPGEKWQFCSCSQFLQLLICSRDLNYLANREKKKRCKRIKCQEQNQSILIAASKAAGYTGLHLRSLFLNIKIFLITFRIVFIIYIFEIDSSVGKLQNFFPQSSSVTYFAILLFFFSSQTPCLSSTTFNMISAMQCPCLVMVV